MQYCLKSAFLHRRICDILSVIADGAAVRIEAAKHLLTEGNSRMSDIAFDVGYQDSHYFSYLFKKHVGVSPREYRSRSEER